MAINDPSQLKAWETIVPAGSGFGSTNLITIPGVAKFSQITNESNTTTLLVRVNGDPASTFTLGSSTTQVFNDGDVIITSIDFANHISGGGTNCNIQVLCGVVQG